MLSIQAKVFFSSIGMLAGSRLSSSDLGLQASHVAVADYNSSYKVDGELLT
jgi:hypothetical protein